jgi:hypothetical protein
MRPVRFSIIFASLGAIAASALAQDPAPETTYQFHPERARRPLELTVKPGDRLLLNAGGCVRAPGGEPRAYLQPFSTEEQGLIFIPGVTMAFVPIADLAGSELRVPANLSFPGETKVWIDWGRYFHDPLESPTVRIKAPTPCDNVSEPPRLTITVSRRVPTSEGAESSLTLELLRYDRNLLPLNPVWAGSQRPELCGGCEGFRVEHRPDGTPWMPALHSARCTRQQAYVDAGGCRPGRNQCPPPAGADRGRALAGHVNWGPATFTGLVSTNRGGVHLALDGDLTLFLEPDGSAGLLQQKPKSGFKGVIELEFASAETSRWFRSRWWRSLPFRDSSYRAVGAIFSGPQRHPGERGKYPSLQRRPATVIGIFGIDTEHGAHPELHPVHALAIQTESHPDRDVWQVFARNWGTGGDCSGRLDERIGAHRVALILPGTTDKTYASAAGIFFDHGLTFSDWKVYAGSGGATLVVDLPADRSCSVVEGELTLQRGTGVLEGGSDAHFTEGEPSVGEPVRLDVSAGKSQLCVKETWFLRVP